MIKEKLVVRDKLYGHEHKSYSDSYVSPGPRLSDYKDNLSSVIKAFDNLPESAKMIACLDEEFMHAIHSARKLVN